jgi:hypothetical protein
LAIIAGRDAGTKSMLRTNRSGRSNLMLPPVPVLPVIDDSLVSSIQNAKFKMQAEHALHHDSRAL